MGESSEQHVINAGVSVWEDDVGGVGEAGDAGEPGERDRATRALDEAYERARAAGYRPGSPQMQALELAEQDYRRARRRHQRAQAQRPAQIEDRQDTVLDLGEDDQQVDLRDPVTQHPRPPRRRGGPPHPPAGEPE